MTYAIDYKAFRGLDQLLETFPERFSVRAFGIKVMRAHECLFEKYHGFSDTEGQKPVSPDDLYDLYSLTKPVTAAAVMQLYEKGLVDLEDKLSDYLPEFARCRLIKDFPYSAKTSHWPPYDVKTKAPSRAILIRHLLTMTAGMTYEQNHPEIQKCLKEGKGHASTLELIRAMARMPLVFEPGEDWEYSLAYDVLAGVIEKASGQSFSAYLKNHIFNPLGMKDSYILVPEAQRPRLSALYECDAETGLVKAVPCRNSHRLSPEYESGGAGLTSTVRDYARFADALACSGEGASGERILKQESVAEIGRDWLNQRQRETFAFREDPAYSYGFGVRCLIDPSRALSPPGEFGWAGAAGAYTLMDRKNQLSITYAHHILNPFRFQRTAHPEIRDEVCRALRRL